MKKLSMKQARSLARQIQVDADKGRATFVEQEANRDNWSENSNTDWIEALQGALICSPDKVPEDFLSIEQLQKVFKNKHGRAVSSSQVRKRVRSLIQSRKVEPKSFKIAAGGDGRLRKVIHYRLK